MKKSIRKKAPSPPSNPGILREVSEEKEDHAPKEEEKAPRRKYSSDESSEEEDTRDLEGNIYTKSGMEVMSHNTSGIPQIQMPQLQVPTEYFLAFLDLEKKRCQRETLEGRDRG